MSEIDKIRTEKIREIKKLLNRDKEMDILYEEFALIPTEAVTHSEELKSEIDRLTELVYKDELTKVLNRRGFMEKYIGLFTDAVYHKKNPDRQRKFQIKNFSILFVDGDNFKSINDNYGHDEGDAVLKSIAAVLKDSVRAADSVGRFGGEEFVVALLGADEEDAYNKAEEIRRKMPNIIKVSKNPEHLITASFGVASLAESDADNLDELIAYADQAMYEAKSNRGKNNTVKFSEIDKK